MCAQVFFNDNNTFILFKNVLIKIINVLYHVTNILNKQFKKSNNNCLNGHDTAAY